MSPLPKVRRVITTHDSTGASKFLLDAPSPTSHLITARKDLSPMFSHLWTTVSVPVDNDDAADWAQEASQGKTVRPGMGRMDSPGLKCQILDVAPMGRSPMHRTLTYDVGIIFEGEIWLELDGGESKLLRKGDVFAQRGTNHSLKNKDPNNWARIYVCMTNSLPVTGADGEKLGPSGLPVKNQR